MNLSQLLDLLLKFLPTIVQTAETIAAQKGLPVNHPDVVAAVAETHNMPAATA
jgi:hypothetical protein